MMHLQYRWLNLQKTKPVAQSCLLTSCTLTVYSLHHGSFFPTCLAVHCNLLSLRIDSLYLQPVLRIPYCLFIWNLALPWEYWLIFLNWGVCFPCNPWIIGPTYNILPHSSSFFVAWAVVNYSLYISYACL